MALAIVVGSTGCQKEDELMPSGNNSISHSGARTATVDLNNNITYYTLDKSISIDEALAQISNRTLPTADQFATSNIGAISKTEVYNVIKIDHQSGKSRLPDYTVTVRSDGWVIYDGHLYVRVLDRIAFRMTDITFPVLHEIFDQYSFYYIFPDFKPYADAPMVYTTYQPYQLERPRMIYDDYHDNPAKLVMIRTTVENLLGIGRFVTISYPDRMLEPSL